MKPEPSALEREIDSILGVDPSPEFVSRVRARIAGAPAPSAWGLRWMSFAAVAMASAIVLALVITRPREEIQSFAPELPPTTSIATNLPSVEAPVVFHVSKISKRTPSEPEVLVSPREVAAMQRFLSGPPTQLIEISIIDIKPEPLPELTLTPIPRIDLIRIQPSMPMAVFRGDLP